MKGGWPSLAKLLGEEKPPARQTNEQIMAAMKAWASLAKH